MARDDRRPDQESAARYRTMVAKRSQGIPSAYLLGEREFFGRSFVVDHRVLVPRPETEHLVETALDYARPGAATLDLGTGSGCVGLSIALESREAHDQWRALRVTCTDRSLAALAVCRTNRRRLGLENDVDLICADLDSGFDLTAFEVIVSNPPYVDPDDSSLDDAVRRYEPHDALFPSPLPDEDASALAFYRRLFGSTTNVPAGTVVIVEIGIGQGDEIVEIAQPRFDLLSRRRDYAGIERVLVLTRKADAGQATAS